MGVERVHGPLMYSHEQFTIWTKVAINALPPEIIKRLDNVEIVVEDWPDTHLSATYEKDGCVLVGVYIGVGMVTYQAHRSAFPRVIKIFQGPVEIVSNFKKVAIQDQISQTLWHEVGHHLGMEHHLMKQIGL